MEEYRWKLGTTEIVQGCGCSSQLPYYLEMRKATRVFMVVDQNVKKIEAYSSLAIQLAQHGFHITEFEGVTPNPKSSEIKQGVKLCRQANSDIVVAMGGGSVMDAGKAIAFLSIHDGEMEDYDHHHQQVMGNKKIPLICIPTTLGTGSEISRNAVISKDETGEKFRVIDDVLRADMVFLDPTLSLSLPSLTTRSGIVDAFSHAFEAYTKKQSCTLANPYYDACALQAMRLLYDNIPLYLKDEFDLTARTALQWGAFLGGIAMEQDLNANHVLAGILHRHYPQMNHGIAVGILLPTIMEVNLFSCIDRYIRIGTTLGIKGEHQSREAYGKYVVENLSNMIVDLDLPTMQDYDCNPHTFHELAKEAYNALNPTYNPKELSMEDIFHVFMNAYKQVK